MHLNTKKSAHLPANIHSKTNKNFNPVAIGGIGGERLVFILFSLGQVVYYKGTTRVQQAVFGSKYTPSTLFEPRMTGP